MAAHPGHPTWDDIYECVRTPSPEPLAYRSRAPRWHTNDADVTDFGPSRLDDEVRVIACSQCGKVVLEEALSFHTQNCKLIFDIADGRVSPSIIEGDARKRRSSDASDVSFDASPRASGSKKLSKKQERRLEVEARKKARVEAQEAKRMKKTLAARRKGPTDVDTQCGVINDKGLPCSRSLTCKSHSMGAKRAVPGRTRPYDELLLDWQRVHNPAFVAKLEEKERTLAASKAAAAERKHRKAQEKKKKKLLRANLRLGPDGKPLSKETVAALAAAGVTPSQMNAAGVDGATTRAAILAENPNADMFSLGASDVDVDAELSDLVMAIRTVAYNDRTRILPLAQRSFAGLFTRKRHGMRACRDLLREGLRGSGTGAMHQQALGRAFLPSPRERPPSAAGSLSSISVRQ